MIILMNVEACETRKLGVGYYLKGNKTPIMFNSCPFCCETILEKRKEHENAQV